MASRPDFDESIYLCAHCEHYLECVRNHTVGEYCEKWHDVCSKREE